MPTTLSLALWLPGIGEVFGGGYRGFNAAQWALGVDAINDIGLIESRLGAIRSEAYAYGSHPPLLILVLWIFEVVLGKSTWSVRLPGILAGVAAIWLLWHLARAAASGTRSWTRFGGVMVAATTPMFLVFGPMIDTWTFGFAFGVAVLLVLSTDAKPWHGVVFAACAVCSWQGVVLVVLALPAAARRFGARSFTVYGGAIGVGLTLWYSQWVGSPNGFDIGWPFDGPSLDHLLEMLGWTLPFVPAAMVCRDRVVAGLAVLAPAAYGVAMSGHADLHPYWMMWWLIPVALGAAAVTDRLANAVPDEVVAAAVTVPVVGFLLFPGPTAEAERGAPTDAAKVIAAVQRSGQTLIPAEDRVVPWLEYGTGLPVVVRDLEDVPPGTIVVTKAGHVTRAEDAGER